MAYMVWVAVFFNLFAFFLYPFVVGRPRVPMTWELAVLGMTVCGLNLFLIWWAYFMVYGL